ncbi:pantoate--beta-alanine ligase [Melghirimyces profundicolus]|uniref:Pantothenate synthetase n=1 Tax=Melghirimyces profundicolus TaxID=1242148 RepID=A0A2T6BVD3_9BACL|nr:pantoate--beta-alanine ligase [Melghirimyces profundicolus]PTX59937.1 pantoate--beta-alanine ligase [Melghirimyces profundicolus]
MKTVRTIDELRKLLAPQRRKTLGLVPTMGYLHRGHLSLIERAVKECDRVVVSLFVNPLQFGPGEDLERYPRDPDRDVRLAEQAGADILFAPSTAEMYPAGAQTVVRVSGLTDRLCGASRPGHFDGVATVVSKLFHIVEPDRAYFGLKDAQQVAVIQRMVEDLNFPVTIVPCPTVREEDGLAMSSRNVYLSAEDRKKAASIYRALREATRKRKTGEVSTASQAVRMIREQLEAVPGLTVEYAEVLSYPGLEPVNELRSQQVIAAVAVRLGRTRLIDNVIWPKEEGSPCSAP